MEWTAKKQDREIALLQNVHASQLAGASTDVEQENRWSFLYSPGN